MTNVIPIRPGIRSEPAASEPCPTTTHTSGFTVAELFFGYDEDRAERDLGYISTNLFIVETTCARAEEIRTKLFVSSRMSDFALGCVEQKRERLRMMSLHELCQLIMLSNRQQWSVFRSYYGALVMEFVGRLHQANVYASNKT